METTLWIIQALTAAVFLYSGVCKTFQSEQWLITHGQTGVVGLPAWLIKCIGVCEVLGSMGLILPVWLKVMPVLTPVVAIAFCIIMLLALRIHIRLKEPRNVFTNIVLFLLCTFVAYFRLMR